VTVSPCPRAARPGDLDLDLVVRVALLVDEDRRAGRDLAAEHEVGERILDVALDRAAQRPAPIVGS
jgi:hypothetical protein